METETQLVVERATLRWLMQQHPEWTQRDLATYLGRSLDWVKKWRKRFRQADPADVTVLHSHSRARKTPPPSIADQPLVVQRILAIRDAPPENLQRTPGPEAILYYLHRDPLLQTAGVRLPRSQAPIWKILRAHERIAADHRRKSRPLELKAPGEEVQLDLKDAGTVPADVEGKQQHVVEIANFVDAGTSIWLKGVAHADFHAETLLETVAQFFQEYGLPRQLTFDHDPRFVGSASGRDFPSAFVRFLLCLGVQPHACPPHRPDKKDLFDFAQEVLESNKRGVAEVANYHTTTTSVIHDILYPGPEDAKKRYINVNGKTEQYSIEELRGMKRAVLAKVSMWDIEQIFLQKFTERLQDTERFKDYEQRLTKDEENKKIEGKRKNLQEVLHDLTERIDGLFLTLQSPKLEQRERDEYIEARRKLIRRREAIQNEIKIQSPIQVYLKYKDLIDKMGKYWERYPFEDRQALVALLVRRVYLEPLSHYFMQITIEWKAFPADVGIMWRRQPSSLHWTPEEDQILDKMYPTESPQAILEALPHRSWIAIQTRASKLNTSSYFSSVVFQ